MRLTKVNDVFVDREVFEGVDGHGGRQTKKKTNLHSKSKCFTQFVFVSSPPLFFFFSCYEPYLTKQASLK
jgi:hypothetical protein